MLSSLDRYVERQRAFWNVSDERVARFGRVFTDNAQSEALWQASAEKDWRTVMEGIEPLPSWTLLEIGCGTGRLLAEFKRRCRFRRLIAVDMAEAMIRFARKAAGDDGRISLHVNDGCGLAMVPDASVDFAYSADVFIHIYDVGMMRRYLREVRRVLKNGGLFRFNVMRFDPEEAFGNSLGGRLAKRLHQWGLRSPAFHRWSPGEAAEFNGNLYSPKDLERLVKESGLAVRAIRPLQLYLWCTTHKSLP